MRLLETNSARCFTRPIIGTVLVACTLAFWLPGPIQAQSLDPRPPKRPVKLIFIHHSCGENWLSDRNGGLGRALDQNNYFVSDTNYGWGPGGIGDRTDITDWPEWFTGPQSERCLDALFREQDKHSDYTRTKPDPGGENQVVMFKSCFPNSNLEGRPVDRPARGHGLSVTNAKAIYNELLRYFATRPDKLFVVITAPPVQDRTHSSNARAFNTWLVRDWLSQYRSRNVAVFDLYNVLTGPRNHHRFRNGEIEHVNSTGTNTLHYPSNGDDHPSRIGNRKATDEFIPLLNVHYSRWAATAPKTSPGSIPETETPPRETTVATHPIAQNPTQTPRTRVIDDFERKVDAWAAFLEEATGTRLTFSRDQSMKHGGEASLGVCYNVAPEGWATCSLVHDQPRDWSDSQGLSLCVHAEKLGQPVTIVAYGGKSSDDLLHFEYRLSATQAAVDGWQRVEIHWDDLEPAPWQGEPGDKFDPRSAMGIALAFEPSDDEHNIGRLWIDDITLCSADGEDTDE